MTNKSTQDPPYTYLRATQNLENRGWPDTTLFTGPQTIEKHHIILDVISNSLWTNRIDERFDKDTIMSMVNKGEHPDCIQFKAEKIKIGDRNEEGTIRHLTGNQLAYAPRYSKIRFVYFEDASMINNEAESALLKNLEESPEHTRFFLSTEQKEDLKDTIISRSLEIPIVIPFSPEKIPNDPWERLWVLSQKEGTRSLELARERGWITTLKSCYDRLNFNPGDYPVFEEIAWGKFREHFKSEKVETQTTLLALSFIPLYYALRDNLTEGKAPHKAPFAVPPSAKGRPHLLYLLRLFETFFHRLETRYFGTRPPALNIVVFDFLSKLIRYWDFTKG